MAEMNPNYNSWHPNNKNSEILIDISSEYRISIGTNIILLTESRLLKKLEISKISPKYQ